MDDIRVGRAIKVMRARRSWRQQELADSAGVSRQLVSKIECGRLASVQVGAVRRICEVLGCRLEWLLDSPGHDLDRLLNAGHGSMHEAGARLFRRYAGWVTAPEVSFSVYGERGVIDVLGYHEASRSLLVVELKTVIVDVNDILGSMDRRTRLAPRIARDRGWNAASVSAWLLVADTATNRRRVAAHSAVLRGVFPGRGRDIHAWLREPHGRVAVLSFLAEAPRDGARRSITPVTRRVRTRPDRPPRARATPAGR